MLVPSYWVALIFFKNFYCITLVRDLVLSTKLDLVSDLAFVRLPQALVYRHLR